jgi:hypothetical protein
LSRNPTANSIGTRKVILPPHIVPIQLKNFTPVGTAIVNVIAEKNGLSTTPVVNMWWAHTPVESAPIARVASTNPV